MAVFVRRSGLAPVEGVREAAERGAGRSAVTSAAATNKDETTNASPQVWATLTATGVFVAALLLSAVALFGTADFGPGYEPAEGIGAFALFFVVAQAAERLVEMAMPYIDRRRDGKNAKIATRNRKYVDAMTRAVGSDEDAVQAAADAQAEVDQLRANRAALVFGCTAAIGMLLCGYLEADFLGAVGVRFGEADGPSFVDELVLLAVTGLVVGGGSKALHDTISNISKSNKQKDTPPESGGTS